MTPAADGQDVGAFTIRPARRADSAPVRVLVAEVLREFGFELETHTTDADLEDLAASYHDRGGAFDVVEDLTGEIVGCAGVYPLTADPGGRRTCELRKMYLRPAVRGHGVGRALLQRALGHARALGFDTMELETASNLVDAIALYQRYGFVEYSIDGHCGSRCDRNFRRELST